jgi:glycosyltransferase involved in cell wall biosynthesis
MASDFGFALYYHPNAYTFRSKIMGRQAAGLGFLRAVAHARLPRIWCYSHTREFAVQLANQLAELGAVKTGVAWVPSLQPARLSDPGLLYRPDPGIAHDAWTRDMHGLSHAYSICGVTHTIATHATNEMISALLRAPIEPWDALICTSASGRSAVENLLEMTADQLRERVGASRFTTPQLPVIPLGVHTADFAFSDEVKFTARQQLGISDDEIAVLFAGRLIVHGKAHPLPMYAALEKAAHGFPVVVILAGIAPSEEMQKIFQDEAHTFCPSVRVIVVDGSDFDQYRSAWAAADIFTSLSDSFQETFGLTPIEAMSAALPSVVSDWDGYREGIRDGVDGFRIPTLALAPGRGGYLADRYDVGVDNFDYYSGHTGQFVAVDVELAAAAYRKLISDPALRRRMGHEAQQRARAEFDWSIVLRRYQELWKELGERRARDWSPRQARRRPDRPDPFTMFATYPTHVLRRGIAFMRREGMTREAALELRTARSINFATAILPSPDLIEDILALIPHGKWMSFEDLVQAQPNHSALARERALVWLAKMGVLRFRAEGGTISDSVPSHSG